MRIDPGKHPIKWIYYKTSEELLGAYWRDPTKMPLAIVFNGDDPINGPLKYEVRTNPSFVVTPSTTNLYSSMAACRQSDTSWTSVFPIETGDSCPVNQYYYSGFIALQTLLDYTKIGVSFNYYIWGDSSEVQVFVSPKGLKRLKVSQFKTSEFLLSGA